VKLSIFALVVAFIAGTANSQHVFVPNHSLPLHSVELSPSEVVQHDAFFQSKPDNRPDNVPATHVLLAVYQRQKTTEWKFSSEPLIPVHALRFLGWTYLPAKDVNRLHRRGTI
jgi:hypothetical protein